MMTTFRRIKDITFKNYLYLNAFLLQLKNKLSEIEKSLSDREANMLSNELKQEYERQLQNIRALRALYEERARIAEITRLRDIAEQKGLLQAEVQK